MSKKPTVLMILDGYGLNDKHEANAVFEGKTPVMDKIDVISVCRKCQRYGSRTSGRSDGKLRSWSFEYGRADRISGSDKNTKAIQDGDFFENEALLAACKNAKEHDSALHMFGLVSDGGVHSHNSHIYGLLELAKKQGLSKFMYTVSWMDVIHRRHLEKTMYRN